MLSLDCEVRSSLLTVHVYPPDSGLGLGTLVFSVVYLSIHRSPYPKIGDHMAVVCPDSRDTKGSG